jgi:hypothetical protein
MNRAGCSYAAIIVSFSLCWKTTAALSWSEGAGFRSVEVHPGSSLKNGFTLMDPAVTGVAFTNVLQGDAYLTNAVAHNGSGVAIGDVDGDGWQDIYLCTLQGSNRLYRNLGNWRFEEMDTGEAACVGQLSTGATFADVDGDGDLDLLVNGISAGTRLFLNDGKGKWTEAKDSGLSRTASATSLALADIDGDGDLDLYCTHYIDVMHLFDPTTRFAVAKRGDQWEVIRINGESTRAPKWQGRFEALPDGKVRELPEVHGLYRNDGRGHFTPIQFEPGVFVDEEGKAIPPYRDWGLAVMFRDLNGDGIPDLYVCNDNVSPDRIWINSGRGTFRPIDRFAFRHTSRSSMGVDFADIDRDGQDDLIVVDMLARDHSKRMTQLVRDRPDPVDCERIEERPQYNRNMLFFGRPDGSYEEAAFIAGVAATDWSWSPVFMDVDLDGYEDLLVTNGFEFDVMDQDSQNEISDPRRRLTQAQLKRSMQFRPKWRTRNAAFRNRRDGTFEPMSAQWGFDREGVSFGMAQGDLDNDGDLDLVVNNLNEGVSLYRNDATSGRIAVRLKGLPANTQGIGARVQLVGGSLTQAQEIICGGRYLSGDQATRVFAADPDSETSMRLEVRWRNGTQRVVNGVKPNRLYEIDEPTVTDPANSKLKAQGPKETPNIKLQAPGSGDQRPTINHQPVFEDLSSLLGHVHKDDSFDDWSRQPLLPRRLSRLGPGVSWYDLNEDGWEDLIVGAGRGGKLAVFTNDHGRGFARLENAPPSPADQGTVVGWPDGKGNRKLLVAVSNYEMPPEQESEVAVYSLSDIASPRKLLAGKMSLGPMALADIDGDGDLDLFVGGRCHPGRYPAPVSSVVWLNVDGELRPNRAASEPFESIGLVSGATFADLDGDGLPDLALAMEWGPVRVFLNRRGHFEEMTARWGLADQTGWWTSVTAGDFDGDGRMDLACGNWGRNTDYALHQPTEFRLYYGDWNGDGIIEMIESWRSGAQWFPVHDRTWLARAYPELSVQFPTHQAFASATVGDLLGPSHGKSLFLEAAQLSSMVFLNRSTRFEAVPLPREAQLAPAFSMNVGDVDGDGIEDLFVSQNFFGTASDISRDDSGRGLWLRGTGRGTFTALDASVTGIAVYGEQRGAALADFNHDGRVDLAVSQNGAPTKLYVNRGAKRGLRVALVGPPANPDAVGAQIRVVYAGDRKGPSRTIQAGSGYWSQDASPQILGLQESPVAVWIRWPGGKEQIVRLEDQKWDLRVEFNQ